MSLKSTLRRQAERSIGGKAGKSQKEVLGFTDMNILQNNGPIAGQTVFHFHIHLIPRREGDGINVTWTPGEAYR